MFERRFLDQLAIGAYRLDATGLILEANAAAARLLGIATAEELLGRNSRDLLVSTEWADGFLEMLQKSGVVRSYRTPLRHADGSSIWVEHHALMRDENVEGVFIDTTALVESELRIARAHKALDSLVMNTPGVAIQIYDSEGIVQLWNPASEHLYGYDAGDVIGRKMQDLVRVDSTRRFDAALEAIVKTGDATGPALWPMQHRDGSPRYVWSTMFPLPLADAELLVGCMDVDVTEQQRIQERLENSRRQLTDSERIAHVGSWEWFYAEDKVWWSEELCRIFGVEYTEEPTRRLADFVNIVHPDDRQMASDVVSAGLETGEPYAFEHRILRPDGIMRDVLSRGEITFGPDEKPAKLFGTVQDITFARRAEELVRRRDAHLKVMVEQMPAIVWTTDLNLMFTSCRGRALRSVGLSEDELAGRAVNQFFHSKAEATNAHRQALQGRSAVFLEQRDGASLQSHVEPLRDVDGNVTGCIGVAQDVTEQRAAEEQVAYLAYHDALTSLPNRLLLGDRLTLAIAQADRRGTQAAVIFLDVDHFKLINDTLGHGAGDRLLQQMAQRLRATLRSEDTIARVGGDEFVVVLPYISSPDDAARVAQQLLQIINVPYVFDSQTLYATASSGIAIYPRDGRTTEDLLRSADSAMYRAKELGRNNYQLCTPELTAQALERLSIENGLRVALEQHQFVVYYQPIVDIESRTVVGAEALVRWQHPQRGLMSPATFIPVAEDSRLILPLGDWVLVDACRQLKEWRSRNVALPRLAINLSARQLQHGDVAERIQQIIATAGLDPTQFDIEITESSAMQNIDTAVPQLRRLADLGAGIVIDDFGVGYSSLNYLKRLPITGLKIDRSFIADFPARSATAIVQAIIATARALELRLIAEGIETEEQATFLRNAGCSVGQGFLFSQPLPAAQMEGFVSQAKVSS
jgi:diguanylate cyclase (GGDEF)-like protein/PAS domain S-box-containing protein